MTQPFRTIDEFMTPDPYAVDGDLTIHDAADRMAAHNIRHLLVLEKNELRGVVGASDLNLALALSDKSARELPVSKAMRPALSCNPKAYLSAVARDMEDRRLEQVVVINGDLEVIGIFTLTDALRALRELALAQEVVPQTAADSDLDVPNEREKVLPKVRVKRMLRARGSAPNAKDGLVLGSVI